MGDGARLEVMSSTAQQPQTLRLGGQHRGMRTGRIRRGCETAADAMFRRMQCDGVPIFNGSRRTSDGTSQSSDEDIERQHLPKHLPQALQPARGA